VYVADDLRSAIGYGQELPLFPDCAIWTIAENDAWFNWLDLLELGE
jgi:hypothetical protein